MVTEFTLCDLQHLVIWNNALTSYEKITQLPLGTEIQVLDNEYTVIPKGLRPSEGQPIRGEEDVNTLLDGQRIRVYLTTFIKSWANTAGLCTRKSLMLRSTIESAYTGGRITSNLIEDTLNALAGREFKERYAKRRDGLKAKVKKSKGEKPDKPKKPKKPKKA